MVVRKVPRKRQDRGTSLQRGSAKSRDAFVRHRAAPLHNLQQSDIPDDLRIEDVGRSEVRDRFVGVVDGISLP
jgi:hypothetical protein